VSGHHSSRDFLSQTGFAMFLQFRFFSSVKISHFD